MPCFECLIFVHFLFDSGATKYYFALFISLMSKQRRNILGSNQFSFSALFCLSRIHQGSKVVVAEELSACSTEQCNWLVIKSLKTPRLSSDSAFRQKRQNCEFQESHVRIYQAEISPLVELVGQGIVNEGAKGITHFTWNIPLSLPAC